jgi:hypothetical protein
VNARLPAPRPTFGLLAGLLSALSLLVATSRARADDEAGLWRVWRQIADKPDDPVAALAACDAFLAAAPSDPLADVVRGLAAWRALKLGRPDPAAPHLERMLAVGDSALGLAAAEIARAWLTRLDIEKVRPALRRWYVKNVAYPETLDAFRAWPAAERPPLTDRWGQPWAYRPADLQRLKGFRGQRYELACARLGPRTDLAAALAAAPPLTVPLVPRKVISAGRGTGTVRFTPPGAVGPMRDLSVGMSADGLTFAYLGARLLVFSTGEHWIVVPRPSD